MPTAPFNDGAPQTGAFLTGTPSIVPRYLNSRASLANRQTQPDPTNGWGNTYARTVHDRNASSNALAAYRSAHPGQPDDPTLVAHIQSYDRQIEHMNSVSPGRELQANIAAAGGAANRQPHGPITKAAPDRFYAGLANAAGWVANLTGDIDDLAFGLPVNAINGAVNPGAGKLQFNTEPYYGYDNPSTLHGQIRDLPHALSTAGIDLYNHPIGTLLEQLQYLDPNMAFGAPAEVEDAGAAYQLRRLSEDEKGAVASAGTGRVGVNEPIFWKPSNVNGKKVYRRDDLIDPNRVDSKGRTNVQRMQQRRAPIGPDGNPMHLHHLTQEDDSPLAEVTQKFHDEYRPIIHIDPPTTPSRINRPPFDTWRKTKYWPTRAKDFQPPENRQ